MHTCEQDFEVQQHIQPILPLCPRKTIVWRLEPFRPLWRTPERPWVPRRVPEPWDETTTGSSIVEVRRTGTVWKQILHFCPEKNQSAFFDKISCETFISECSRESIRMFGMFFISVFLSTPPSRGVRSILRSKMVENHENQWFHCISKGNIYDSLWKIP